MVCISLLIKWSQHHFSGLPDTSLTRGPCLAEELKPIINKAVRSDSQLQLSFSHRSECLSAPGLRAVLREEAGTYCSLLSQSASEKPHQDVLGFIQYIQSNLRGGQEASHRAVGIMWPRLCVPFCHLQGVGFQLCNLLPKDQQKNEDIPWTSIKWIHELMSPVNGILPI